MASEEFIVIGLNLILVIKKICVFCNLADIKLGKVFKNEPS